MLQGLAAAITVQWGWRRAVIALAAGALSALAMPPFDLFPVLFLTFPVLIWLLDGVIGERGSGWRHRFTAAAWVGWLFGFGYFLAGLYWIGAAFLVEAETFGWLMPFAVVLLPAGLALLTAVSLGLARLVWRAGPSRIFVFALFLTLGELARGYVFTGFPWNLFGQALATTHIQMQLASVVGIYGLTALSGLVFAAPAMLGDGGRLAGRLVLPALAALILAGQAGFGIWRLPELGEPGSTGIFLRIVQPNIPQAEKWKPENRAAIFADYLDLSDAATSPDAMGAGDARLIIWPESALPFFLEAEPNALPAIAALLPDDTTLITGLQRPERDADDPRKITVYNSVAVIDGTGAITYFYDKAHLVPFGEYLPYQALLESLGLQQLTRLKGGFGAGTGLRTRRPAGIPAFSPLICYEIIFPGAAFDPLRRRPDWLLNLTNDAWFGDSAGPWQHLRFARLRAVEEGLPVIRAANTGVSAVIGPDGAILRQIGLNARGLVDAALPAPLPGTAYNRHGWLLLAALLALYAIFGVILRRRVDA